MKFKKFEHSQNEDGSFNILKVPIFNLGKFRGFDFTEKWFKKVIENHNKKREDGYLPPVILGHNSKNPDSDEKPAVGLFDNLILEDKTILADLVKIPETIFEKIKERAYPHRSVEVYPRTAKITALALLGGTEPAHKLPVLEIFKEHFHSEDKDSQILHFYLDESIEGNFDKSLKELVDIDMKRNWLRRLWDTTTSRIWNLLHSDLTNEEVTEKIETTLSEASDLIKEKPQLNKEENVKDEKLELTQEELDAKIAAAAKAKANDSREAFKAEHGMYPEDMAQKFADQKETSRKDGITSFCAELKGMKFEGKVVAPAVIDDMVQPLLMNFQNEKLNFAEKEMTPQEAVQETIKTIFEKFQTGDMLVPIGEEGEEHHDDDPLDDGTSSAKMLLAKKIDEKAEKLAAEKGITYKEAVYQLLEKEQ